MLLFSLAALAAPTQLTHTGRLLDATGVPLAGSTTLTITLYDATGTSVWTSDETVDVDNGYFSVMLDGVGTAEVVDGLEIGIAVNGGTELPRQPIASVPWALRSEEAAVASSVSGGVVDASEIRVGGNVVIDSSGGLVSGQTIESLGCSADQIPLFDGTDWGCAAAASATTAWTEVTGKPAFLDDDVVDWSEVQNTPAVLDDGDIDWTEVLNTPAVLDDGDIDWTEVLNTPAVLDDGDVDWTEVTNTPAVLDDDMVSWGELDGVPTDLADGRLDWASLDNVPSGLDDGDDDTIYTDGQAVTALADADVYVSNTGDTVAGALAANRLSAVEGVQIGQDTGTCGSAAEIGTLTFDGSELSICTSAGWEVVWPDAIDGSSPGNAGSSCLQLLTDNPGLPDGPYWIAPLGVPLEVYCDMTTDDGGWTLIHKTNQGNTNDRTDAGHNTTALTTDTVDDVAILDRATMNAIGAEFRIESTDGKKMFWRGATYHATDAHAGPYATESKLNWTDAWVTSANAENANHGICVSSTSSFSNEHMCVQRYCCGTPNAGIWFNGGSWSGNEYAGRGWVR